MVGRYRRAQSFGGDLNERTAGEVFLRQQRAFQGKSQPVARRFQAHVGSVKTQGVGFFGARQAMLSEPLRPSEQSRFGKDQVFYQKIHCAFTAQRAISLGEASTAKLSLRTVRTS